MTLVKSINKAYWLNVEESYNCKKIVETDFPIWIVHSVLLTSNNFQIADAYLFFLSLKIWIVLNIAIRIFFFSQYYVVK